MERKLVVPGIYRHFKDKMYCTVGISKPIEYDKLIEMLKKSNNMSMNIKHTEKDDEILSLNINGEWYHISSDEIEELVLYKSLYDYTGIYARPLSMFLSEVDEDKYPNVKQRYRMELVGGLFAK